MILKNLFIFLLLNFISSAMVLAKTLTLKTKTHEDLWLKCEVQDTSFQIFINGSNAGSAMASGSASATTSSGLGVYGAMPGKNTLKFEFSEIGKLGKISCDFLNRQDISDIGKKIHHIALNGKELELKSFILDFILDCKGYYPKLEPLFSELKTILTKGRPDQNDEITQMSMRSARKMVIEADDEASAKNGLLKWIEKVKP